MDFKRRSIRYSYSFLVISLLMLNITFGSRDYIAVFENFKCISTSNFFIKNMSCNVDKSGGASAIMAMQREVVDLRMDTYSNLALNNNGNRVLFNYKRLKTCEMFNEPVLNPMLKIVKQMMKPYCNLPEKCPISSSFVFKMTNYSMNTEYLPAYFPECKFKTHVNLTTGNTLLSILEISGRIRHKRGNAKGRKTYKKS